ncbi:MAG TPA: hypothetical protein VGO34_14045 [Alphaproteobacteria bacterium]|jgi:hypothetical protein
MSDEELIPKEGERYEVMKVFDAEVLTLWKTPATAGYDKTLPRGLRFVVVEFLQESQAVIAEADPYADWEATLVDEDDIEDPDYDGYGLVIPVELIASRCVRREPS